MNSNDNTNDDGEVTNKDNRGPFYVWGAKKDGDDDPIEIAVSNDGMKVAIFHSAQGLIQMWIQDPPCARFKKIETPECYVPAQFSFVKFMLNAQYLVIPSGHGILMYRFADEKWIKSMTGVFLGDGTVRDTNFAIGPYPRYHHRHFAERDSVLHFFCEIQHTFVTVSFIDALNHFCNIINRLADFPLPRWHRRDRVHRSKDHRTLAWAIFNGRSFLIEREHSVAAQEVTLTVDPITKHIPTVAKHHKHILTITYGEEEEEEEPPTHKDVEDKHPVLLTKEIAADYTAVWLTPTCVFTEDTTEPGYFLRNMGVNNNSNNNNNNVDQLPDLPRGIQARPPHRYIQMWDIFKEKSHVIFIETEKVYNQKTVFSTNGSFMLILSLYNYQYEVYRICDHFELDVEELFGDTKNAAEDLI
jgi:hypothetical protein